jgi:hypothetical protein
MEVRKQLLRCSASVSDNRAVEMKHFWISGNVVCEKWPRPVNLAHYWLFVRRNVTRW